MSELFAESPAPKTFAPDHAFAPFSRATFGERRLSLMKPAVPASLIELTMLVPVDAAPPPVAVVSFVPSGKMMPLVAPVSLMLPPTSSFCVGAFTPMPTLPVPLPRVNRVVGAAFVNSRMMKFSEPRSTL